MKRAVSILGIICFLSFLAYTANAAPVGKFTQVRGQVDITSPGGHARAVHKGDPVNVGDIVRTKAGAKAEIRFIDGSLLRLAQKSRVKVNQYMVKKGKRRASLSLFRGKIRSMVKSVLAGLFGRSKKNRYEIHTPTAVLGVRGTDFFSYYLQGVSGALCREGHVYGYPANNPEAVKMITAGQALLIKTAEQAPVKTTAPPEQIENFEGDTDPGTPPTETGGEGAGEPTVAEMILGTEETGEAGGGETEIVATGAGETEPDIPFAGPALEGSSTFSIDIPDFPQYGESAILAGSIDNGTNVSTQFSLSGNSLNWPTSGTWGSNHVEGGLTDNDTGVVSAMRGTLQGVSGSWEALLSTLWVGNGEAGYVVGALSGTWDEMTGAFSGNGTAIREYKGPTDIVPDIDPTTGRPDISSNLISWPYPLPVLQDVVAGGNMGQGSASSTYAVGIETLPGGRKLGVWGVQTSGGTYTPNGESAWHGMYGDGSVGSWYMIGDIHGSDDLAGHLATSGFLVYMDDTYFGGIDFSCRGYYNGTYTSAEVGTYTLDPLAWRGSVSSGELYTNANGDMVGVSSTDGRVGGFGTPWQDATSRLLAMGDYTSMAAGTKYVWDASLYGEDPANPANAFNGFLSAVVKDPDTGTDSGPVTGNAAAITMDSAGNASLLTMTDFSGDAYPGLDLWKAAGTWTRTFQEQVDPVNYMPGSGYLDGGMDGDFNGTGGISGHSPDGSTLYYYDMNTDETLPWGVFALQMGESNSYSGKPSGDAAWSAKAGGDGTFGEGYLDDGYWLADATGTWSDAGDIISTLTGHYLTRSVYGNMSAQGLGINNGSGYWISEYVGTYQGTPLAYSGWTSASLFYNSSGYLSSVPDASLEGKFGGIVAPWGNASSDLVLMGAYDNPGSGKYLWDMQDLWGEGIPDSDSYLTGFASGVVNDPAGGTGLLWGAGAAIYMDTSGNAGILTADGLSGATYPGIGMWEAAGTWTRKFKETVTDPLNFSDTSGNMGATLLGKFDNGDPTENLIAGYTDPVTYTSGTRYFQNFQNSGALPWGIYDLRLGYGNTFFGKPAGGGTWSANAGGPAVFSDTDGYWIASATGTWSADGDIAGALTGTFLTPTLYGDISGPVYGMNIGTASGDWIAGSTGTYEGQPLHSSVGISEGQIFRMVEGTWREGEFGRYEAGTWNQDADYDYEDLISSGGSNPLYGFTDLDEWDGDETEIDYFPDAQKREQEEDDGPPDLTLGSWSVGSHSEDFYSTPPAPPSGYEWRRHYYGEHESTSIDQNGLTNGVNGILGVAGDLWNATAGSPADLLLKGTYEYTDGNPDQPFMVSLLTDDPGDTANGAYQGFLGAVMDGVDGGYYAVYIDPEGNGGILVGDFTGDAYPGLSPDLNTGMWEADGTIYPVEMEPVGIYPDMLGSNTEPGIMDGSMAGGFGGTGDIGCDLLWGNTLSITGHGDWGVFGLRLGVQSGFHNPDAAAAWSARAYGMGEFGDHAGTSGSAKDLGIWLASFSNGTLQNGKFSADLTGTVLTLTKTATLTGGLTGIETPDITAHDDILDIDRTGMMAAVGGYWHDSQPLAFNGTLDADSFTIVKENHGHWDDSDPYDPSCYEYGYFDGADAGWSYTHDAGTNTDTHVTYSADGVKHTWTENLSTGDLTSSDETWDPSTQDVGDLLRAGAPDTVDDPNPYYYLREDGWLGDLMGSTDDLWAATAASPASTLFLGEYDPPWLTDPNDPQVFISELQSYNPYDGTNTIWNQADDSQNGGYWAQMSGVIENGAVAGGTLGVYLDASGNAGMVTGDFTGDIYRTGHEDWVWEGSGTLYPLEIVSSTGLDAGATFMDGSTSFFQREEHSPIDPQYTHGAFFDDPYPDIPTGHGEINAVDWHSNMAALSNNLEDPAWLLSTRASVYGGTYEGTPSQWWALGFYREDTDPNTGHTYRVRRALLLSSPDSPDTVGTWSNGHISGKGFATWVNWDTGITGVSGAELKGTFNPNNSTWQAAARWASMDTKTFIGLADPNSPTYAPDKLRQLNIPYVNVGVADLTGTAGNTALGSGNSMTVNMPGVTFYAFNGGSRPRIWATNGVTGSYTGTPASIEAVGDTNAWSVPLTGSNYTNAAGLSADFTVQRWDTGTGKWGARIQNGTGTVNSHNIDFRGEAAGTIDTPTTGQFSGTASGTASPKATGGGTGGSQ